VPNRSKWRKVGRKATEGLREIGVLLIVFVPLDFVVAGASAANKADTLTKLFVAGVLLFVMSLVAEFFLGGG
jgi:hypothetical protein